MSRLLYSRELPMGKVDIGQQFKVAMPEGTDILGVENVREVVHLYTLETDLRSGVPDKVEMVERTFVVYSFGSTVDADGKELVPIGYFATDLGNYRVYLFELVEPEVP